MCVAVCVDMVLVSRPLTLAFSLSVCENMYAWVNVCVYVCMYVSMYLCIYVSMYACLNVCMHVCLYVRMYVSIVYLSRSIYLSIYVIYICIPVAQVSQ